MGFETQFDFSIDTVFVNKVLNFLSMFDVFQDVIGIALGALNSSLFIAGISGWMLVMDLISIYLVTFKNPLPVYLPTVENVMMSSSVLQDIVYDLVVMLLFYFYSRSLGQTLLIYVAL